MYDRTYYTDVPPLTLDQLDAWARDAFPPGSFVASVLANDLAGAACSMDPGNHRALRSIVGYVMYQLPAGCRGSKEKMEEWKKAKEKERDDDSRTTQRGSARRAG